MMTVFSSSPPRLDRFENPADLGIDEGDVARVVGAEPADLTRLRRPGSSAPMSMSRCPRGRSPAGGRGMAGGISSGSYMLA